MGKSAAGYDGRVTSDVRHRLGVKTRHRTEKCRNERILGASLVETWVMWGGTSQAVTSPACDGDVAPLVPRCGAIVPAPCSERPRMTPPQSMLGVEGRRGRGYRSRRSVMIPSDEPEENQTDGGAAAPSGATVTCAGSQPIRRRQFSSLP